MREPTRRDALVKIAAAGLSAQALHAQGEYEPRTFSLEDYELLGDLADLILPASDTPGAREAGAHAIIDETLAEDGQAQTLMKSGLWGLRAVGFSSMTNEQQASLLTEYSEADDHRREFFEALKRHTVDAYYSTEIGLVEELGYQGNAYLAEFPGCTHDHSLDGAD